MNRLILGLAVLTFLVMGNVGQAKAGLIGTTVDVKFYYPNLSTLYQDFGSKLVNPTAFYTLYNGETTTISDTQITYTSPLSSGTYASPSYNGYVYDFLNSGNLITKVTIDASSTLTGFSMASVMLTSDGAGGQLVGINLNQGLNFSPGASVVLDINPSAAVPEPSSLTLLCVGALGAFVATRRRTKR